LHWTALPQPDSLALSIEFSCDRDPGRTGADDARTASNGAARLDDMGVDDHGELCRDDVNRPANQAV